MASTAALELAINLRDNASAGLDNIASKGGLLKNAFSFALGGLIEKGIEGIAGAVGDLFKNGIEQVNQWDDAMAQVEAHLKSTGGAAGVTRAQVEGLANSLSAGSGMSRAADDAIASGEAMLLTFTNIGKDVFPAATQAMLDMTTAMNGGAAPSAEQLSGEAIKLGKALNDPIKGLTALSKVGVAFTEQQKDQIKAMVAAGDTMGAQKVILAELGKEFGGSALASAHTFAGSMDVLKEKLNNVAQTMGTALMPALQGIVGALTSPEVMGAIQGFIDGLATGLTNAIAIVTALFQNFGPIVIAAFQNLWASVSPILQQLGNVIQQVLPIAIGIVVSIIKTVLIPTFQTISSIVIEHVIPAFKAVVDWIGTYLPPLISALGHLWQSLQPIFSAIATVIFDVVVPALLKIGSYAVPLVIAGINWLVQGINGFVTAWQTNWGGIRDVVTFVVNVIVFQFQLIGGALTWLSGAFAGMSSSVKSTMADLAKTIVSVLIPVVGVINVFADHAKAKGTEAGQGFTSNLTTALSNGFPGINANINGIGNNLGALQAPSSTYGINIGGNWIGGINSGIANGMGVLNANISAINTALATMGMLAEGQTVKGYGFGPSVGIDKNGMPTNAMTPEETQAAYAKNMTEYLQGQLKAAQQGVDNALADMRENNTHASLGSGAKGLNLFGGLPGLDTGVPGVPAAGGGGGGGGGGGAQVQNAIAAAADMTSKIASAVQAGMTALSQLTNFTIPAGFQNGLEQFATAVNAVMMRMQDVALNFKAEFLTHTSLFLDTAQKAMGLLSSGVDALVKLKDFVAPTTQSMDTFAAAVDYLLLDLGAIAQKWSVDALALMGVFADGAGKMLAMASTGVDTLVKLKDFQAPSADAMTAFSNALDYLIDALRKVIARWDQASLTAAATFGETVGKLVQGLGNAVDTLSKLKDFQAPTEQAVNDFFTALDLTATRVSDRSRQWYGIINKGVADTAGYVGDAISGMLGAIDGLIKLGDSKTVEPTQKALDDFFTALDQAAQGVSDRARSWFGIMNKSVSDTAGYVGSAVSGILGAVDGFLKLAGKDVVMPSTAAIASFFDALDAFVPLIDDRLRQWYGLINESTSKESGYVGTAVSSLLGAIDGFVKLADFKGVPSEVIDAFFTTLGNFLTVFNQKAADFGEKAGVVASELGQRIGALVGGIGQAIDPIIKLADFKPIDPAVIESFMSSLWQTINQMSIVVAGFPAGFLDTAAAWGAKVGEIFSGLKTAMDTISGLAGVDPGTISGTLTAVLTGIQGVFNYINTTALGVIDTFKTKAGEMKQTWNDAWESMASTTESDVQRILDALSRLPSGTQNNTDKHYTPIIQVPGFADGGIVTSPMLAHVGEAGPEAIIPLSMLGNLGGGGINIGTVTIQAGFGADGTRIARDFLDELNARLALSTRTRRVGA